MDEEDDIADGRPAAAFERRPLDAMPARAIRRERPDAEAELWEHLRHRRIGTLRFHRLEPVAGILPSFVCRERRLVVDVTDRNPIGNKAMEERAARLRLAGWTLMRVRGDEIMHDAEAVCERIRRRCRLEDAVPPVRLVHSKD